jgi:hypothetical protein
MHIPEQAKQETTYSKAQYSDTAQKKPAERQHSVLIF